MPTPLEHARAYLDALEADRRAALALCEQKAEEAKLIKARQEGFKAAIEMLGGKISVGIAALGTDTELSADCRGRGEPASDPQEPRRRRGRRPIRELILRELSFSAQTMTASQITKAIDYNLERTETALRRLEEAGQVRNEGGRWAIGIATLTHKNGFAVTAGNGQSPAPQDREQAPNKPASRLTNLSN